MLEPACPEPNHSIAKGPEAPEDSLTAGMMLNMGGETAVRKRELERSKEWLYPGSVVVPNFGSTAVRSDLT